MQIKIKIRGKVVLNTKKIRKAINKASFTSLQHAAAAVRLTARRSIRRSKKPSAPGKPPHTKRGDLRRAIIYHVDGRKARAIIGPSAEAVGDVGSVHEYGGIRGDQYYPKRPFMGPALEKNRNRLPRFWAASVRG